MRKRPITVLVPVLVGIVLCLELRAYLARPAPSLEAPRYLVARRDVPVGQPITAFDFTLAHRTADVPEGAFTDQELHWLAAAKTATPLAFGEILTRGAVHGAGEESPLAKAVPRGLRAYSLAEVEAVGARSGDRVDLFLQPHEPSEPPLAVADAVLVLKVSPESGTLVAMSPVQIRTVEKARRRGKITVALRNPADADTAPAPRRRSKPTIEILSEEPQ